MQKKILSIALLAYCGFAMNSAFAAGGYVSSGGATFTLNGTVKTTTCDLVAQDTSGAELGSGGVKFDEIGLNESSEKYFNLGLAAAATGGSCDKAAAGGMTITWSGLDTNGYANSESSDGGASDAYIMLYPVNDGAAGYPQATTTAQITASANSVEYSPLATGFQGVKYKAEVHSGEKSGAVTATGSYMVVYK
ncbi:TPA: hypothetical protein N3A33_004940 [Salmonella enterica subsp. salamae serovar 28:r:e,n,z15]|nr:hypothetical protein [Salmonella enterica subsp. salamae serovar 28:r:e,n,z15]